MTVSDIMTKEVIFAEKDNTFTQVRDLFLNFNLHHLPVVENENLIGIISTNDVIKVVLNKATELKSSDDDSLNNLFKIEDFMTRTPTNIVPEATIERAVNVFNENNFQALPVVDMGKLVGIVTLKDIINYYSTER